MGVTRKLALIAAGMCLCTATFAQSYPAGPVRVIVPLAAGGGVDAIIRMVAPKLSESWGQPVSVENHVGAGGTLGTGIVAKAAADGRTLLQAAALM